ncbi:MAG: PilZ domain protein [Syntrophorhabdaceae bacterium PtaU1.Bin034]|jgi:hypothetical protein|nr:MAG: PilZ domain protein [Syntrophorhabdaceae bacterium PtaU1.Bin034]
MKKEVTICFRTSEELRNALEAAAREDRRSLSSTIELILTDYLKKNREFPEEHERRRYVRKTVAIPAYVRKSHTGPGQQHGAVILDLSLGGMRLSVPKESVSDIYEGAENSRFETSFVLPHDDRPIRLICKPERVVPSNGSVYVGASFVDAEFINYLQLQKYLV